MAPGRRLRGHRLARRQLLLRRHHGLLPHAARPRLLAVRQVRPRLRRTRGAPGDGDESRRAGRSRSRGTARTSRRRCGSLFEPGDPAKYIDVPLSNYSTWPNDKVLRDGEMVGVSTFSGYSYNERSYLSLAMVDVDVEIGTEVTLVWGEEGGGSAKPGRRAARADGDPRDREPVPVRGGRAHAVPRGLAHESRGLRPATAGAAQAAGSRRRVEPGTRSRS